MAKTIYVVFKRGRQFDGEYMFISTVRAFADKDKAEAFWKSQSRVWQETIQGIECECEHAIHSVELED